MYYIVTEGYYISTGAYLIGTGMYYIAAEGYYIATGSYYIATGVFYSHAPLVSRARKALMWWLMMVNIKPLAGVGAGAAGS